MIIFTNTHVKKDPAKTPVEIDLLPVVKFSLANKGFTCNFVKCELEKTTCLYEEEAVHTLLAADVSTMQGLLTHRDEGSIQDVTEGRIHRLMVSRIGTEEYPRARFCFGPGEYSNVSSKRCQKTLNVYSNVDPNTDAALQNYGLDCYHGLVTITHDYDSYVKDQGLQVFFTNNPYVFLWATEQQHPADDSGLSFFLQ
jgi:hypothetical protein